MAEAMTVFNLDLHCAGCAQKIRKCLKHFTGVKSVKTDLKSNKVTVTGNVDAAFVKRILEEQTKKKVELQSPKPDTGKKTDGESEKKKAEGKKSTEAPASVTVILKTDVHCEGCATKMTKIVRKYKGVKTVNVELSKDQIVITGTMDVKQMLPYLSGKFKKTVVEEVKPKKEKGEDEKKPAPAGAGLEYYGYQYGYGGVIYNHNQAPAPVTGNGFVMEYGNAPPPMMMPPALMNAPQMFSDENPNACSVM